MDKQFNNKELEELKKSLLKIDGINAVCIEEHEPFQLLKIKYTHEDFGKMSFKVETAHAFSTLDELIKACRDQITKDCSYED